MDKPIPVEIVVDNRASVRLDDLDEDCASAIRFAFEHSYRDEGRVIPEVTWRDEGGWLSVPRAGLRRMRSAINRSAMTTVSDRRCDGDFALLDTTWGNSKLRHRLEPWDYQTRAVDAAIAKQNCMVRAPTGSGKTFMAIEMIARIGRPAIVVVATGGLFDQWIDRVAAELAPMGKKELVGRWGDGERFLAPVTIALQQTLARGIPERLLQTFGVFVADELQSFSAPTFFAAVDHWPARYRVGFSADHTRRDGREYMVEDAFGEAAAVITEAEVVASGKVVEVEIRMVPTAFEAPWYVPAIMRAGRNVFAKRAAHKKLVDAMAASVPRNDIIRELVAAEAAAGEQTMVFADRVEHCMALDASLTAMGIASGTMLGGKEGKKQFARTRDGVKAGTTKAVVGTVRAIGVGQDFPSVSRGVLSAPRSNNRQELGQIKGRLCRSCEATGKTHGVLYVLWDREVYGRKALENMVKWFGRVLVRGDDGAWIDGREYLGAMKRGIRAKDLSETPTIDDLAED